jgi:hypothetical protein
MTGHEGDLRETRCFPSCPRKRASIAEDSGAFQFAMDPRFRGDDKREGDLRETRCLPSCPRKRASIFEDSGASQFAGTPLFTVMPAQAGQPLLKTRQRSYSPGHRCLSVMPAQAGIHF